MYRFGPVTIVSQKMTKRGIGASSVGHRGRSGARRFFYVYTGDISSREKKRIIEIIERVKLLNFKKTD